MAVSFFQKDNLGTKIPDGLFLWAETQRTRKGKPIPLIVCEYDNEKDAYNALLKLPFIHIAQDSGELISSEILSYGYYKVNETIYHAAICGWSIRSDLWREAKNILEKSGGNLIDIIEPEIEADLQDTNEADNRVVFVREYQNLFEFMQNNQLHKIMVTYRIFRANNAQAAMQFLSIQSIEKKHYQLIVETPSGNYCRDVSGFYRE
jgi:hypothetical protein